MTEQKSIAGARPPIVAIVGHIDHGKSTLLDYVRKTNIVGGEAGGITQHLSAYEAEHTNSTGTHRITFLDTPGHEAFRAMRSRGLEAADVAILVVSAEEGAKPQTLEALKLIDEAKIPFIVAFSKIDKPGANVEKAKMSLLEAGVFLEGMGGEVPWVAISSKSGDGVPELLDLILLAAELGGLESDPLAPGTGLVIEAHVDGQRGNTATLIIKNGSIKSGEFVVAGEALAPVRIMENFVGKKITEAGAGSPATVVGFSILPRVGEQWHVVETKKEAEEDAAEMRSRMPRSESKTFSQDVALEGEEIKKIILPLVIKTDFAGTGDAMMHELEKLPKYERLELRVVHIGLGNISENDVKLVGSGSVAGLIVGFNVKVDREAQALAERQGVAIEISNIIYKLTEWLAQKVEERRPRQSVEQQTGKARLLKFFSYAKGRAIVGGRVEEGALAQGQEVRLMRRDAELGRGEIVSLQNKKVAVKKIDAGGEFGAMLKIAVEPAPNDYLEAFEIIEQ